MPATDKWAWQELLAGAQKAWEHAARLRKTAALANDKKLRRRAVELEELAEMLEAQAAKLLPQGARPVRLIAMRQGESVAGPEARRD